ncbi:MAG: HAD-IIB family hydrolase [Roseobacter sp.]|jgi:mannosyl-3-phosphoglycerate phosphatase
MTSSIPLVVFSDLDGTLLDHETYSWAPAEPALARLRRLGIPLVLASSKTAAEMEVLQAQLGLASYPAIVENGAGLIGPGTGNHVGTKTYDRLRAVLDLIPSGLRSQFRGFGDMSIEDIAQATGLTRVSAKLAQKRAFSEPGLWSGNQSDQTAFVSELSKHGVSARAGGRFLTLSFGSTKKDRMDEIVALYSPRMSVALGDAPNDLEMIENADHGFIVSNPHHPPLPRLKGEDEGRVQRTEAAGPHGWNAAINAFLDRHPSLLRGYKIG